METAAEIAEIKGTVRAYCVHLEERMETWCVLALPGEDCEDALRAAHPTMQIVWKKVDREILFSLSDLGAATRVLYWTTKRFITGSDHLRRQANEIIKKIYRLGRRNK